MMPVMPIGTTKNTTISSSEGRRNSSSSKGTPRRFGEGVTYMPQHQFSPPLLEKIREGFLKTWRVSQHRNGDARRTIFNRNLHHYASSRPCQERRRRLPL